MIVGLLGLVVYQGATTFWPDPIVAVTLDNGRKFMGEETRRERFTPTPEAMAGWSEQTRSQFQQDAEQAKHATRRLLRTGNFDVSGSHFDWVDDFALTGSERPEWAVLLERREWGRFYGIPAGFQVDGELVARDPAEAWREFDAVHGDVSAALRPALSPAEARLRRAARAGGARAARVARGRDEVRTNRRRSTRARGPSRRASWPPIEARGADAGRGNPSARRREQPLRAASWPRSPVTP